MINFNMSIEENFADFTFKNLFVIVDSFDNKEFNVRAGSVFDSKEVGVINATNSEDLNNKLQMIILKFVKENNVNI